MLLAVMMIGGLAACSTSQGRTARGSAAAARASFAPIARVLTHPRCLNCHTVTHYPRQGDDRHEHLFLIARGLDDRGAAGKRCSECHQGQNQGNGVPGAPNWRLAPLDMAWESAPGAALSDAALCRRLLDQSRNGNRNLEQLALHLESEALVRWAWTPGRNLDGNRREPPPLGREQFLQAFRAWQAAGAPCPP